MKIVHIGTTTKKEKNLTREKKLNYNLWWPISNTSNNEAKSVISIKKFGRDSTFSRIKMISYALSARAINSEFNYTFAIHQS